MSLIDKYPWLDPEDGRRNMTDREILEKYINFEMSCLNKKEKVEVMACYISIRKLLVSEMG